MVEITGYKLIKELGKGGMATVYLAIHELLDREVALKVHKFGASDPAFRDSFVKEGRVVAKLEHPHIVKIYDIGTEENRFYMAMEYVKGGTLKDKLATSVLSVDEIINIIEQTAGALYYAHNKGYIHRDIKPANILFRNDNDLVIADFGIAKLQGTESDLTQMGYLSGTPSYMAPEQSMGEEVDSRTDLYSLGIVLYEMLTGRKPFQGENTIAVTYKHAHEEVPKLPLAYSSVQNVLDKALAKDKVDRYSNVLAFSDALKHALLTQQNKDESSYTRTVLQTRSPSNESVSVASNREEVIHSDDRREGYLPPAADSRKNNDRREKKQKNSIVPILLTVLTASALSVGGYLFYENHYKETITEQVAEVQLAEQNMDAKIVESGVKTNITDTANDAVSLQAQDAEKPPAKTEQTQKEIAEKLVESINTETEESEEVSKGVSSSKTAEDNSDSANNNENNAAELVAKKSDENQQAKNETVEEESQPTAEVAPIPKEFTLKLITKLGKEKVKASYSIKSGKRELETLTDEQSPSLRLPTGRYTVTATYADKKKTRAVTLKNKSPKYLVFNFEDANDDALDLKGFSGVVVLATVNRAHVKDVAILITSIDSGKQLQYKSDKYPKVIPLTAGNYRARCVYNKQTITIKGDITLDQETRAVELPCAFTVAGKVRTAGAGAGEAGKGTLQLLAKLDGRDLPTGFIINQGGKRVKTVSGAPATATLPAGRYSVVALYNGKKVTRGANLISGQPLSLTFPFTRNAEPKPEVSQPQKPSVQEASPQDQIPILPLPKETSPQDSIQQEPLPEGPVSPDPSPQEPQVQELPPPESNVEGNDSADNTAPVTPSQ